MQDLLTKYIDLKLAFPNKAGKLDQIMQTQKRLAGKLSKQKQSEEVKELLLSVGEGYDVAMDLLQYCKNVIHGCANDAESLQEGATIRNINKLQGEEIERLWSKLNITARG